MKKSIRIFILVAFLIGSFNVGFYAKTISDIEGEISDIENEYNDKMSDLGNKQAQYDDLIAQLTETQENIKATENQIIETNNEIQIKEAEIKNLREVKIPDMEEKAQISLQFAQDNLNKNVVLTLLQQSLSNDHPLEVTYATNKLLVQLNNNLLELKDLIIQAQEDEEQLRITKDNLEVQQVELEKQQDYIESLKGEISYSISQLESEANSAQEELEAKKEQERLYEEAGCGPEDVYGVDCAVDEIPESDSGFVRPLDHGYVTNEYGGWNAILGAGQHSGIDIADDTGTPVHPSAPGKVLYSGWTEDGGGYSIILLHVMDGQNYITRYAHLSSINVATGEIVNYGDEIGAVGESGSAMGPHLHFEIQQNNMYVWSELENPRNYVNFPEFGVSW